MTYNELKNIVRGMKVSRSSDENHKRLLNHGLRSGMVWEFKGTNGKRYEVGVYAARNRIWIASKHRLSTLDKWCGESVGHVVELGDE